MLTSITALLHKQLGRGASGGKPAATANGVATERSAAPAAPVAANGTQHVDTAGLLGGPGRAAGVCALHPAAAAARCALACAYHLPAPGAPRPAPAPPPASLPHPLCTADFICASPLLPSCGISGALVEADMGRWLELGGRVAANLGLPPPEQQTPAQK